MTLLLKQIFGLIGLLNSETGTNQIAVGIACGLIIGFSPTLSLQTLIVIAVILIFKIQIGAALISAFFFKFPAVYLDPLFHKVGSLVLEVKSFEGIFTTLYNMPIIPYTKFYNSVVMGAGIIAVCLIPFIIILSKILIVKYRKAVVERIKNTKLFKALKATTVFKWYYKYNQLYGRSI